MIRIKRILFLAVLFFWSVFNLSAKENDKAVNNRLVEYMNRREHDKALNLALELRSIEAAKLPESCIEYAIYSQILATCYMELGLLKDGEGIYREALLLLEKDHSGTPIFRSLMAGIGYLYLRLHDHRNSLYALKMAKRLFEEHGEFDNINYLGCLNNFALLQMELGLPLWSKIFLENALKEIQKHPEMANLLLGNTHCSLAVVYQTMGYTEKAKHHILQALSFLNQGVTSGAINYAYIQNSAGLIFCDEGNYARAIRYFEKALEYIHPNSLDYTQIRLNLTIAQLHNGEFVHTSHLRELSAKVKSKVSDSFLYLSAYQREPFWNTEAVNLQLYNILGANYLTPELSGMIYDNLLLSKGLLLRTDHELRSAILRSGNDELKSSYEKLVHIYSRLNTEVLTPTLQGRLEYEVDSIDKLLTGNINAYRDLKAERKVTWKEISKDLDKDEAAIEFVTLPTLDKATIQISDTLRYYALVIRKDSKVPYLIRLFDDYELRGLLQKGNLSTEKYLNKLYNRGNPRFFNGELLYQKVWEPLEPYLEGIRKIYYAPAGNLHAISFAAIMTDSLRLGSKYDLRLVSSTGGVMAFKRGLRHTIDSVRLYGGVYYDANPESLLAAAQGYQRSRGDRFEIADDTISRAGWNYLPGTIEEVNVIRDIFSENQVCPQLLSGLDANEESFISLSGKQSDLIHIATHGFFLSDRNEIRKMKFLNQPGFPKDLVQSPLKRSGLLMAGANRTWRGEAPLEEIEDGILTADEISRLDLSGTRMVVLSACETGLGEISNTEGVFGLQRAFKLAGVQTLIMSLWQVPDKATSELMRTFYRELLAGDDYHEAFRKAVAKVRESYPSPYYWGGFVILD